MSTQDKEQEKPQGISQPEQPELAPRQPTFTDSAGIERLLPAVDPGWEPAPTEPDPVQVARGKAREKQAEAATKKAEAKEKDKDKTPPGQDTSAENKTKETPAATKKAAPAKAAPGQAKKGGDA